MCFGCSKELSHRDGSFEYPQDMFWFRNKKNNFQLRTLTWGPDADDLLITFAKTVWTKIRTNRTSVLIWIQAIFNSESVPERSF